MSLVLSTRVQNIAPDSIEFAEDLQLGVRANGEEVVSFIDLAGNIYPAEIPQPANAPTFVSLTAAADGITPVGFYGYRYVNAATKRYPLVDGGKSIGGSIAPRGNPSPSVIVNMNVDLNYVNLTIPTEVRKDIDELWVFRTTNYPDSASAQLAADAGLCFYVGKAVNTSGGAAVAFQDKLPNVSIEQIEFDNFSAPTFKYVRYIPPYFWGIGNDQLVVPVSWEGKIVTITDSHFQWFSGRNGQSAVLSGITTGGVDGRGRFIFKAGDEAGFNQQINAILTKNGNTAETLSPSSGTGYLVIDGIGSVLYRSKPRNPFAWGYSQRIGSSLRSAVYALSVATGKATAMIGLPEDQQLKIDFKNPSACYTLNLRLAGSQEFGTTRRLISNYALSSHTSQFFAYSEGRKVLWGWDADTFSILQSDGNSQTPISANVFDTLRNGVRDPFRIQFAHGLCDDENELNCLWIPYVGQDNFIAGYPSTQYKQTSLTDLLIYQHYPSGKWGYVNEFDLTAASKVRNLNLNKPQIIGGTDQGLLLRINDKDRSYNIAFYGPYTNVTIDSTGYPNFIQFSVGTFVGVDPLDLVGLWGTFYALDGLKIFMRIQSLVRTVAGDFLFFDMIMLPGNATIYLNVAAFMPDPATCQFAIGSIFKQLSKRFEFTTPTKLKKIEELYLKGENLQYILTTIANSETSRQPFSFSDNTPFSTNLWRVVKPAITLDYLMQLDLYDFSNQFLFLKGIGLKMT